MHAYYACQTPESHTLRLMFMFMRSPDFCHFCFVLLSIDHTALDRFSFYSSEKWRLTSEYVETSPYLVVRGDHAYVTVEGKAKKDKSIS